jgi:hypothetical protein
MSTLNQMERDFLNIPQVKTALNLNDIRRGQRNVDNAQKRKFEHSLTLATHVVASYAWFTSDEGKEAFREQGLSWTMDDFTQKVFGWGKSYFHKVRRCGSLDPRIVTAFIAKCDELGDQAKRTIAGLDEYGRNIDLSELPEEATEEQLTEAIETAVEETDVPVREESTTMVTLSFRNPDGDNVAFRMDVDGSFSTRNSKEQIVAVLALINASIETLD